ncbi:polyhydroxyalkanoate biosynthesis repressor PhaR [Bacillus sp. AFS031507]|uniref:polyhydroxyalkanoate biosynthesis repressor PhaR n=1 Tax=Bacillus sp. AFS031507 TaxID=2033496 RepID=UPI000BFC8C82|nr:polyhydroxyalkanoate biosynthesis repressor PhaR [Bacillus sp. AFS031507]PGY12993.1 polyhydroxyalkanoate biosynthesis repressor PhaR [Bacillus sp. AFS031507]
MSNQKSFDPYDLFNKFSTQWEKQVNDLIMTNTNNPRFTRLLQKSTETSAMYKEMFKKSQELLGNQLHLPNKDDVANVAKVALQTEEKLDSLEEQIWNLQDSVSSTNKEIESIVGVSNDIIKLTKQLKTELSKTKLELTETKELRSELRVIKNELADVKGLKEEISILLQIMSEKNIGKKDQEESELASSQPK